MAQRGIREYDAKRMMARHLKDYSDRVSVPEKMVLICPNTDMDELAGRNPWLKEERLVVKPDQLFGKRGKNNLILLDADFEAAKAFIREKMGQTITVGKTTGTLSHFLAEPFVPHEEEYYVAIRSNRDGDTIYFSPAGGVDIEENWDSVKSLHIPIEANPAEIDVLPLVADISDDKKEIIADFLKALFRFYADLGFAYLEINPFTIKGDQVIPLDTVARLDDTAAFECAKKWGDITFPAPFGRSLSKEEKYIKMLDEKSGASLKLTILNPKGRVWTMVAGGGASVIYADTVVDLGFGEELANYGEYSGNPTTDETYEYAKTIMDLMTREKDPRGKVLIIGGGIANFTDVAKTFTGIITALREYADRLKENNVKIYVRRGGPNYREGLKKMKAVAEELGLDMEVYGPETHMTKIVRMALKPEEVGA